MQKRPAARPDGPTARSAAERTSPAAAVVQRVVRLDNRPATGNLPQLAAVVRAGAGAVTSRRGPAAPGGTAPVVQRAVRVGAQGAEILYTEVADAVAAAKKAGVDLTAVIPVITPWFNDGLTHDYATWQLFAAAAHGLPAPAVTAPVAEAPALSDSESAHSDELESPRDNAPRTPGSPARSESDTDSDSGAEAAARLRARLDKRSESSASAPRKLTAVKVRPSTINFSQSALVAASALNIDANSLESRKPHKDTSTGGGGGGTDHKRADGKAAVRASKIVAGKIREKTGANVKPADYLKGRERASEAAAARSEKSEDRARAKVEAAESDVEARRDWLAHLAPAEWRKEQATRANDVRPAPPAGKAKKLAAQAKLKDWPLEWNKKYGKELELF